MHNLKIALIYPPTCDPTAPYLSVPLLTGYLRSHGVEVLPIDANIEAYDRLLQPAPLIHLADRLERRLARLERKSSLVHVEQLAYAALWQARGEGLAIPSVVEEAVAILRDGSRFFDFKQYETAIATIESALHLISAAFTPLTLNFTNYRTPFSLLNLSEIEADTRPERHPFYSYFADELCPRLATEGVKLAGISVAFPGQIQPAYSLALILRQQLPHVHITVGGPAITQILIRLKGEYLKKALSPFHSVVIFEGERALLELIRSLEHGRQPMGLIKGQALDHLNTLPCPDFDGLPLDKYFSPHLVLPYDFSRGCNWGKCAFCHYGLAETGTARYRQRPVEQAVEHLDYLARRYDCRIFYLSHDSMPPAAGRQIAKAFQEINLRQGTEAQRHKGTKAEIIHKKNGSSCAVKSPYRWATDMRPEAMLTQECCRELAEGGAISIALGVESASPRILELMNKGTKIEEVKSAICNLASAGIAVEAMCFTDFPTESYQEAMKTIRFLNELHEQISLFICGQFDLVHGAFVAQQPQRYGLKEIWQVMGDEFGSGLFYEENLPSKSQTEREKIEIAIAELSKRRRLGRYPWAGSLSTAHSLLWYDHYGRDIFKKLAAKRLTPKIPGACKRTAFAKFDVEKLAGLATEHENQIWHTLVREKRTVTRRVYQQIAHRFPPVKASPGRWQYEAGYLPIRVKN